MSNLFEGWDKEKLAVAAENIHDPTFDVCDKYYQLGSAESKRRFPFNLNPWKERSRSGLLQKGEYANGVPGNNKGKSGLKSLYFRLLHFTGLYHYKRRYRLSRELLLWIKEFSPDIIYSQLSSIELIGLVKEIHKKLDVPIAIHIMDDWPLSISKSGLFKSYWRNAIDKQFRQLISKAKVLMSISEAMSNEYMSRYGYKFVPFHNPIDLEFWTRYSKRNYAIDDTFTILYAGRIGVGIENSFFDIAEAVGDLNAKGLKIRFHIQATNSNPVLDELSKFTFITINPTVPYSELPRVFSQADVLLLPNDFDRTSRAFLKYSMPTKASEYMISGTPILLYSSAETAVTSHALKYNWAYVVSEKKNEALKSAITELYERRDLRTALGNTARDYAINNYDGALIREQFRKAFILD